MAASETRQGPGWWMDPDGGWNPPENWPEATPPLPGWIRGTNGLWSAPEMITPAPVVDASTLDLTSSHKAGAVIDLASRASAKRQKARDSKRKQPKNRDQMVGRASAEHPSTQLARPHRLHPDEEKPASRDIAGNTGAAFHAREKQGVDRLPASGVPIRESEESTGSGFALGYQTVRAYDPVLDEPLISRRVRVGLGLSILAIVLVIAGLLLLVMVL